MKLKMGLGLISVLGLASVIGKSQSRTSEVAREEAQNAAAREQEELLQVELGLIGRGCVVGIFTSLLMGSGVLLLLYVISTTPPMELSGPSLLDWWVGLAVSPPQGDWTAVLIAALFLLLALRQRPTTVPATGLVADSAPASDIARVIAQEHVEEFGWLGAASLLWACMGFVERSTASAPTYAVLSAGVVATSVMFALSEVGQSRRRTLSRTSFQIRNLESWMSRDKPTLVSAYSRLGLAAGVSGLIVTITPVVAVHRGGAEGSTGLISAFVLGAMGGWILATVTALTIADKVKAAARNGDLNVSAVLSRRIGWVGHLLWLLNSLFFGSISLAALIGAGAQSNWWLGWVFASSLFPSAWRIAGRKWGWWRGLALVSGVNLLAGLQRSRKYQLARSRLLRLDLEGVHGLSDEVGTQSGSLRKEHCNE